MTRTVLAIAWTLVLLGLAAPLHAQSLAGVAKKAEQERAKAKEEQSDGKKQADKPPTKVYTNRDLSDDPRATATPLRSDAGASSGSKATSGSETKDEDWWRSRAVTLRRTLADDQTKLAAAKAHYDSLPDTVKGAAGSRPVVDAAMRAKEEITHLTAVVANDQRAITELEQDARRAGVLPGWLRDK